MAVINKELRNKIYNKYDGHCAYCGKEIKYEEMQIDHLIPKRQAEIGKISWEEVESENNLMPSCRKCNNYKRCHKIETFREYIQRIPDKLLSVFIFKIGIDYGLIEIKNKDVEFYYEKHNK